MTSLNNRSLFVEEYAILFDELMLRKEAAEENFRRGCTVAGEGNNKAAANEAASSATSHHHRTNICNSSDNNNNNDDNNDKDNKNLNQIAAARVIRTRAELLGLLQCAQNPVQPLHQKKTQQQQQQQQGLSHPTTEQQQEIADVLAQMRLDMDRSYSEIDACFATNNTLYTKTEDSDLPLVAPKRETTTTPPSVTREEASCAYSCAVNVNAFFEEYPEFVQGNNAAEDTTSDEDQSSTDSSSSPSLSSNDDIHHDDDDDDDNDDNRKHRHESRRKGKRSSSAVNEKPSPRKDKSKATIPQPLSEVAVEQEVTFVPPRDIAPLPTVLPRPQSANSQRSSKSNNVLCHDAKFSYTNSPATATTTTSDPEMSHQQPQQQQQWPPTNPPRPRPNPYAQQRPPPPLPITPAVVGARTTTTTTTTTALPTAMESSMLPSSWEDLHSGLNHFRTAREIDAAGSEDYNRNWTSTSSQYATNPYHQRQQQEQSQVPLMPLQQNHAAPCHGQPTMKPPIMPQQQQPMHPYDYTPPMEKLVIRESLKRKFHPPKRTLQASDGATNNGGKTTTDRGIVASAKGPSTQNQKQHNSRSNSNGDKNKHDHENENDDDNDLPEELKRFGKELVEKIESEIMHGGDPTTFQDIAGLDDAKQTIQEIICWPMKRPDLFTGLRRGPNALLLYGPPGTGKTLIGKAIAHESGATFFSISSSSLTSKWIGEGEKLVRTMFAVAAYREPAVVFIDEIDSLLTQRKSDDNEASRRIKTEFLVQMDGTGTSGQGRVLTIGATNRPQELDEAARRRFVKRLYIPLPNQQDRLALLHVMLRKNQHDLTTHELEKLAKDTDRFSGADLKALCEDAALGPLRSLPPQKLENVNVHDLPPISYKHFRSSLRGMNPSVSPNDLIQYEEWDKLYGSKRAEAMDDDDDDDDDNDKGNGEKGKADAS